LQIEDVAARVPVYISDIKDFDGALEMIQQVGAIIQKEEAAVAMCNDIADLLASISSIEMIRKKVAYLIWRKPFMAVNRDTFINDMLQKCGYENVFADAESRYPEVSLATLIDAQPDFIFLSSEPYPFKELHVAELLDAGVVKHQEQIILVDGEMFSWYGSRLLKAVNYFKELQESTLFKCTHLLGS
jgi:ABC-type Fe3+-hydroxamate transport system substrate-binding protein